MLYSVTFYLRAVNGRYFDENGRVSIYVSDRKIDTKLLIKRHVIILAKIALSKTFGCRSRVIPRYLEYLSGIS